MTLNTTYSVAFANGQISMNLKGTFPSHFAMKNVFIPNEIFNLVPMPLHLVEFLIIALNPNGPKSNPSQQTPNLKPLFEFLPYVFPKEVMFSVKVEFLMNSSPTQIHHDDEPGPLLSPLQLESNPKIYA